MGLLSWLKNKNTESEPSAVEEVYVNRGIENQILELDLFMNSTLSEDRYISRREFLGEYNNRREFVDKLDIYQKDNMLDVYCSKNGLDSKHVADVMERYHAFEDLVEKHNEEFVEKEKTDDHEYLDSILSEIDPNIHLDDDQQRVVLTDEDYVLVIAGAGAGKTTTVAAKVKYLVEKKNVEPEQILVVSFTNKAVNELREKINKDMGIPCPIATFHSTGNAILRKQSTEKLNIVENSKMYYVIQDYFRSTILQKESAVNNLITFFASYFDVPYEGFDLNEFFNKIAKGNYSTMRSDLNDYQAYITDALTKKKVTIQNEFLRSYQEVEIANFLYLNGIEYEYEPVYPYNIDGSGKPYTPDFAIHQGDRLVYLEHFGITDQGKNCLYSEDELVRYKKAINDKVLLHRKHKTELLYTFSGYKDGRTILDHLEEELRKAGIQMMPRSNEEVMEKLVGAEENRYIRRMLALLCRFISNFKTNGYQVQDFDSMYRSTQNVRTRLFLDIAKDCYLEYERWLREHNAVDFQDMINNSAALLREVEEMKQKLDFKYVIVDEYQDISRQRFDLVTELSKVTDAKIIAVGDDWQSIYAFSGSDITLFTNFREKMGYAEQLKIERTYRNSQEVIDIAGNFIQKNTSQIQKSLISGKRIKEPVIIYTYDGSRKKKSADRKTGADYELACALQKALEQIMIFNKEEDVKSSESGILVLGRFGFEGDRLEKSGLFEFDPRTGRITCVKYPFLKIQYMTAHASKGLGYDNVIVINGKNETYGFPSKIEDDPVLSFVVKSDKSMEYAEERRLFYVAMTRTKKRVYFLAPQQNPSEFLLEIKRDYENVVLKGEWSEEPPQKQITAKKCPICGYPLQHRYKNGLGLRLFICTNEPEMCGFMTNQIDAGAMQIMKCDQCSDGYMIVKHSKKGPYFLGCTNYKNDKSGCNHTITEKQYYEQYGKSYIKLDEKETVPVSISPQIMKSGEKEASKTSEGHDAAKPAFKKEEGSVSVSASNMGTEVRNENKTGENSQIVKPNLQPVMYKSVELGDVVFRVIRCLIQMSEKKYFGTSTLIDILRGSQSEKIKRNHLDQLKDYNSVDLSRDEMNVIVNWLIEHHYILKTNHPKYPVLHPTYESLHYADHMTQKQLIALKRKLETAGEEE